MIIKSVIKFLPTCLPSGLTVAAPDSFCRIPGVVIKITNAERSFIPRGFGIVFIKLFQIYSEIKSRGYLYLNDIDIMHP